MSYSGVRDQIAAADSWLVPESASRVLVFGEQLTALVGRLVERNVSVVLLADDDSQAMRLGRRYPYQSVVLARWSALPFSPHAFDVVLGPANDRRLQFAENRCELARVTSPGGHLGLTHTARDDSVPWVRRLATVVQAHVPTLMTARLLSELESLTECPYFPDVEARNFRLWVPITREGMVMMVTEAEGLSQLQGAAMAQLSAQVADIYDSSARQPEPLSLPYAVQCWRAEVDHTEFTSALDLPADGLTIPL